MKEMLEIAVNLWYNEWLKTHDEYESIHYSEMILEEKFPNVKFIQLGGEYKVLQIFE